MSVASLNNGQLQLSELVISNEKYSNATGYVASSSTFTSNTTGTSLTTPEIVFTGVAGGTPYLTSGGTTMVLSTPYQGGLLFSSPGATAGATANQASIALTANQALTCSGSLTATTFRGGIAGFTGEYGFGLNAGETVSNLFTIPNFVGTASSSYVISPNGTGAEVAYPLLWNIAFSSQSGTSTNVNISIFNVGSGTATGAVNFSVIAIN